MQIRNDAPAGHRLIVGDIEIDGGQTAEVPDAVGKRLLRDPHTDVSLVPQAPQEKPEAKSEGRKSTTKTKEA